MAVVVQAIAMPQHTTIRTKLCNTLRPLLLQRRQRLLQLLRVLMVVEVVMVQREVLSLILVRVLLLFSYVFDAPAFCVTVLSCELCLCSCNHSSPADNHHPHFFFSLPS